MAASWLSCTSLSFSIWPRRDQALGLQIMRCEKNWCSRAEHSRTGRTALHILQVRHALRGLGRATCARRQLLLVGFLVLGACDKTATTPPETAGSGAGGTGGAGGASGPGGAAASIDSAFATLAKPESTSPTTPPPSTTPRVPPVPPPVPPPGPPPIAKQREVEFRALGQDPSWLLEIDQEWIMFVDDTSQKRILARVTEPEHGPGAGGFTFHATSNEGRAIVVIWEGRACEDVAAGGPFENVVTVQVEGVEYRGCGRRITNTSEPNNR